MRYLIMGTSDGGEHTVGTIPKEVAEYWKKQSDFEEYVFDTYDRNEDGTIPKKYQLPDWHKISDVMQEYALEYSDGNIVEVIDTEAKEYLYYGDLTELDINNTTDDVQEHRDANENFDGGYVFTQAFAKEGVWQFELETDNSFDITKLKVNVSVWSDTLLVNSLTYDGGDAISGDSDGSVGKSFSAWIE